MLGQSKGTYRGKRPNRFAREGYLQILVALAARLLGVNAWCVGVCVLGVYVCGCVGVYVLGV